MAETIRFGVYELDQEAMELRKDGSPIKLQEQPFKVLALLAERPGKIVTREELREQIWGNTFVDFDQSLNKAINRVREALNDNAATPEYVETVPRRGYRFIAPVSAFPANGMSIPPAPATINAIITSEKEARRSWIVPVAAIAVVALLAIIGIATAFRWRQPRSPAVPEARLITSFGWQPTLSRDGKLLAYVSSVGDEPSHIWVQQTAGGEAIPVTAGPEFDDLPDFSPDGTRIAFYSARGGGGIYTTSTLPGEPRLLVGIPKAIFPRFSPDADRILYLHDHKAFTVSVNGGQPTPLPVSGDFIIYSPPFWSPGGKEILFSGSPRREPNQRPNWWIGPVAAGQARMVHFPGFEQDDQFDPYAWIRAADEREWILYSITRPHSWKLCRIRVSARGTTDEAPEIISSGNGSLGPLGGASRDGKLAYTIVSGSASIYQISINARGQKSAPTLQLPLREAEFHNSPSVTHDGKWMAYVTDTPGKPDLVVLRNLETGSEHLLDDNNQEAGGDVVTSISPDGSRVLFERDCKEGLFHSARDRPLPCGYLVSSQGGGSERVCLRCTPRGFSSDGGSVLLQKYDPISIMKDRITELGLRTKTEHDFLSHPDYPLYHPFFSWDDRWVVFKKMPASVSPEPPSQILIAPVRHGLPGAAAEWIAVTDGTHSDDKPQFSADGNTVYFTSTRDGYLCIWAQRLHPVTKHPLGSPVAFEHFHNTAGHDASIDQIASDLSVARDKMLINLPEIHSAIWMLQTPQAP
ncbi:MAG: winged helix-turn-helix domain-containing protein [Acidobacteriaceae bacterium]|jgi:DNA-binding winged helix-turn-helix (wHTH) protein